MKKINLFILFILTCLFSVNIVKADMGMPDLEEVEAVVTNQNGIKVKDYTGKEKTIPYGTTIKISKFNDRIYYEGSDNISLSDVKIVEQNDYSEYENQLRTVERKTLKSTYLYSGPSELYSKIVEIPANTTLYTTNLLKTEGMFVFTEYNGQKGFVNIYNYFDSGNWVANKEDSSVLVLKGSLKVYTFPDEKENYNEITIDNDKEYKTSYSFSNQPKSSWYYVDELNGWIFSSSYNMVCNNVVPEPYYKELIHVKNKITKIYKNFDLKETIDVTIDKNSLVEVTYYNGVSVDEYYYYITYNGVSGWIKDDDNIESAGFNKSMVYKNEIALYDDFNRTNKVATIKKYDEVEKASFDNFTYIKYNDKYYYAPKKGENDYLWNLNEIPAVLKNNTYIYKEPTTSSEKVGSVKKNVGFKELYSVDTKYNISEECHQSEWYYVEYKSVKGWIHVKSCRYGDDNNYSLYAIEEIKDEEATKINEEKDVKDVNNNNLINNESNNSSSNNVNNNPTNIFNQIYIYIIIGVAISLAALVSIILIVKKSKKSKVDTTIDVNNSDNINNNTNIDSSNNNQQ